MKLLILFWITFVAASAQLAAADTLTARIVDRVTGQPIERARASADDASAAAVTDERGYFSLHLPDGSAQWIDVTAAGYESLRLAAADITDTIELVPVSRYEHTVTVTETRAVEGQSPVAFTNITREEVAQQYWAQDVPMLLALTPSAYAYSDAGNGVGYSYLKLRGFDQRRIAVTINGVPWNDPESHEVFWIDLPDLAESVQDIQIQRGAGASLYGGNPIGGSVNLETLHLPSEPSLTLTTGLGSYDTEKFSAAFQSGHTDNGYAFYGRYSSIKTDGYRDQSWSNLWSYFVSAERFGQKTSTRLNIYGGPEESHLAYKGLPKSYLDGEASGDADRDRRVNPILWDGEIDHFYQPHYELLHDWQALPRLSVRNTLYVIRGNGYYDQFRENREYYEYNLPPVDWPDGSVIDTTDLVRRRTVNENRWGWVPRFVWDLPTVTVTSGLAFSEHQARHQGVVRWAQILPPGIEPNHPYYDYQVTKRSISLFAQAQWQIAAKLRAEAGAVYASHRSRLSEDKMKGVDFQVHFDWFVPRIGVKYDITRHVSAFANVSQSKREPVLKDIYDPQDPWSAPAFREVDIDRGVYRGLLLAPESVTDYEVGTAWSSRRTAVSVGAYWMDFDNEIVYAGQLDDNGVPINGNAARSDHRGLELEAAAKLWPGGSVSVNASVSDDKFRAYEEYDWEGNMADYSGNRIAGFPGYMAQILLAQEWRGFTFFAHQRWIGRQYVDNTEDERKVPERRAEPGYISKTVEPYAVLDTGLSWDVPRPIFSAAVTLSFRINNALDSVYETSGYVDGGEPLWIPAAGRNVYGSVSIRY